MKFDLDIPFQTRTKMLKKYCPTHDTDLDEFGFCDVCQEAHYGGYCVEHGRALTKEGLCEMCQAEPSGDGPDD